MTDTNDIFAAFAVAPVEPAAESEVTENAAEQDTFASASDIEDALALVTSADPRQPMRQYDAHDDRSTARGVGSITMRSGGKTVAQRIDFSVAKMDEVHDLRQQMIDEGRLVERPGFMDELSQAINPVSVRNELRSNAQYQQDLAKLEAVQGTRATYPHIANAKEDVAQTLLSLCRNPADAELLAAVASILPDYMRHQQKERHIMQVQDAQAEAVSKHIDAEMSAAIRRLEFRSGLLSAGGDAELAQDLSAWAKRGNKLSIKSNLSAAPHLIPLLKFHDAKTLEQVLCDVAQFIPENGHRFSCVMLAPDNRYRAKEAYADPEAPADGFGKVELSFNFTRVDASTVHVVLRERAPGAGTWSQAADMNPFVVVGAWDVYGSESSSGELAEDAGKVRKEQAANIQFLKTEAESAGVSYEFPALWKAVKQAADTL